MRSWPKAIALVALGLALGGALGLRFAPEAESRLNRLGYSAWPSSGGLAANIRPDRKTAYKDYTLDGRTGKLRLHVFGPRPGTPKRDKTILFFHGGSWNTGSPLHFYRQCTFLAERGFGCISAEYRIRSLHGTGPLAALVDARDAIAFARSNLAAMGLPDAQLWAGGASAGGHLAILAAGANMPELGLEPVRVDGLILLDPVLDTSEETRFYRATNHLGPDFSPLESTGKLDFPVLVVNGGADVVTPPDAARKLVKRLRASGAEAELELYGGLGHGFFSTNRFREVNARMLEFLEAH